MKHMTKRMHPALIGIFLIAFAVSACTPIRLYPVWRPWTRSIGETESIKPDTYTLKIEGEDHSTVGDEQFLNAQLSRSVEDALSRRGFSKVDADAEYDITMNYRAGSQTLMNSTTVMENRSSASSFYLGMAAANASSKGRSLGVAIAALIGVAASSSNASTVVQSATPETQYDYAVALAIRSREGQTIWQGDAVWQSSGIDILDEIRLPLQLLASGLPSKALTPHVNRLKADRSETFYNLHCKDHWFSSPAVPYRIQIEDSRFNDPVKDKHAYLAYIDLLERAEISVPISFRFGQDDYTDVSDPYIWRKVLLGGEYLIGPIKEPTKILITLETDAAGGYKVADAHVATAEDYSAYLTRLAGWRSALQQYYDLYE
ncbi:MAG: hypothetical protein WBQ23_00385 [Bacteroidota bacterium]